MTGTVSLDGSRLKAARAAKGLSQEALANHANLSPTTIEKAEAGGAIHYKTADRILTYLGLQLQDVQVTPASPSRLLLPPRPESIIGRGIECREVSESLCTGQRRLVLYGFPGIGKTTVASELAYSLIAAFRDGVFWATLAKEITDAQLLHRLLEWARQCSIPDANLIESIVTASYRLRAAFLNKNALLIIDDVWQRSHANPFCVAGPNCGILITTRNTLIAEELWPEPAARRKLDGLSEDDSLALLRENAGRIVDDNIDQCRELVRKLDGLPAALHVAGKMLSSQQARGRDIEQLIADLSSDVKPLLDRIVPTRHGYVAEDASSTVFALIDKSYQQLDPDTKRLYVRLCGFPPSPTMIPFDKFVASFEQSEAATEKVLEKLVDVGLVEFAGTDHKGRRCFRVHALVSAHSDSIDWDTL